jgi:hypothetical protein
MQATTKYLAGMTESGEARSERQQETTHQKILLLVNLTCERYSSVKRHPPSQCTADPRQPTSGKLHCHHSFVSLENE